MLARLAFFLLLIAPPIALAADAPSAAGSKITVVAQPAPKADAEAPAPAPAPLSPLPAGASPAQAGLAAVAPPTPPDASSCRMDCAQSYYVCRTGDQPDECGGGWSQCVAACNSPNLAQPFSTAP